MLTCFDIGGSRIKPGFAPAPGQLMPGDAFATPGDFTGFVAGLARCVVPGSRGVSIAVAGVMAPETGVMQAANVAAINGRALVVELRAALGLPVWVANDADCFALAEAVSGAGAGHRNVFGIILGTGVGGGLVIDGRIVTGAGGYAGEWGHGPVLNTKLAGLGLEIPHFPCGCGLAGCVDTVGGARGIEQLHRHLFGAGLTSPLIVADWLDGEPSALLTVQAWLELVSGPLALVLNVTGSSVVPVGGGLASVPELIAALDAAVQAKVLRGRLLPVADGSLLVPAAHRIEPGLIGAALLGFQGLAA